MGSASEVTSAMVPQVRAQAHAAHQTRLTSATADEATLDSRGGWIANGRALAFVAAAGILIAIWMGKLPRGAYAGVGAIFVLYIALAILHDRVLQRQQRAKLRQQLARRGLDRIEGRWHQFKETGAQYLTAEHLYAADLDVFGQGSIFQLVDETGTRAGEQVLASWLSQPPPFEEIGQRQGAVRELTGLAQFRETLAVEARVASTQKADPRRFIAWAEGGPYLDHLRWTRPLAWALPAITLTLYVLGRNGVIATAWWWLGLFAQLAVLVAVRRTFSHFYDLISVGESGAARFERAFLAVEAQRFEHPYLQQLGAGLEPGAQVSKRLGRFERLLGFADLRRNQLHPVINLLTLWDVHTLFRLETWRKQEGPHVRGWFDALAQLEALSSLAGLAHDRPEFTFPEVTSGGPLFVARGLGHPLLEAPIRNDVSLDRRGAALLITGSNMSGKTTLVRALGANAVLALCGAPVCADSLRLSRLLLVTSMRVKDSLERGVSYFYAEVLRLKAVLDGAQAAGGNALFLLDEILLGTNTRERQVASRRVLELLLDSGAIGAVTTHDLALTELASRGEVRNVHFRDLLVDGEMVFDYRLRDGVVDTTNALRLLEKAGIPVGSAQGG